MNIEQQVFSSKYSEEKHDLDINKQRLISLGGQANGVYECFIKGLEGTYADKMCDIINNANHA